MKTYRKMLTLSAFLFLSACEPVEEPSPQGPSGSWWVGGADGGAYIVIDEDQNPNDKIYQGKVYFDTDKSLWYEGRFQYQGGESFDYQNKENYSGWDGEGIILKNNGYLKALDPIPAL